MFPPTTSMVGAGNSWCHAWEFHPGSSFTPTLPSCAEVHIKTPGWRRARYAKPGNIPNAWLRALHYICPTSPLRHLCPLAAEKQVVLRGWNHQPSAVTFPRTGDMSSLQLLEDQKPMRPKTEGVKYIPRVAPAPTGIEGRFNCKRWESKLHG